MGKKKFTELKKRINKISCLPKIGYGMIHNSSFLKKIQVGEKLHNPTNYNAGLEHKTNITRFKNG